MDPPTISDDAQENEKFPCQDSAIILSKTAGSVAERPSLGGNLPDEIYLRIFHFLTPIPSTCLGLTCKKLYGIHHEIYGRVGIRESEKVDHEDIPIRLHFFLRAWMWRVARASWVLSNRSNGALVWGFFPYEKRNGGTERIHLLRRLLMDATIARSKRIEVQKEFRRQRLWSLMGAASDIRNQMDSREALITRSRRERLALLEEENALQDELNEAESLLDYGEMEAKFMTSLGITVTRAMKSPRL